MIITINTEDTSYWEAAQDVMALFGELYNQEQGRTYLVEGEEKVDVGALKAIDGVVQAAHIAMHHGA